MFRSVELPEEVSGHLYLHSMPGRYEAFQEVKEKIAQCKIDRVIRLASLKEVRLKSPDYALHIEKNQLPWIEKAFPVPDYEAPGNLEAFWDLAKRIANRLRRGKCALIHCGAGIGRTGTLAVCVLIALGIRPETAEAVVEQAGSKPEVESQKKLIEWVAENISRKGDKCKGVIKREGGRP